MTQAYRDAVLLAARLAGQPTPPEHAMLPAGWSYRGLVEQIVAGTMEESHVRDVLNVMTRTAADVTGDASFVSKLAHLGTPWRRIEQGDLPKLRECARVADNLIAPDESNQ